MQLEIDINSLTPMMQQYLQIKAEHQTYMLFYRMGDFYELFFDDAVKAAEVLDIVLTKRGKNGENDIPMCGVPVHSHESYLEKLIKAGFKVAICEQMESPEEAKKRGHKAVVRREVTRIITSGTILEESLLDSNENNFLCCVAQHNSELSISWVEISTGQLYVCKSSQASITLDLARFSPKEVIVSEAFYRSETGKLATNDYQQILSVRASSVFDLARCQRRIKDFYKVSNISSFGSFAEVEEIAIGALLEYLEHTQKGMLPRLSRPQTLRTDNFMLIDPSTKRNLEIEKSVSGDKKFSLINIINKAITASGSRLLSLYLNMPLLDPAAINNRLDAVSFFIKYEQLRLSIRNALKQFGDIERALGRICIGKGELRDLAAIRNGLIVASNVSQQLSFCGFEMPSNLNVSLSQLGGFGEIIAILESTLKPELPATLKNGNFVIEGFNVELDSLYELKSSGSLKINELQAKYRDQTNIPTLKISFNNVLGYFIEVTPSHKDKIKDESFIHRQTLGSSIRFSTLELKELEENINTCDFKINQIEQRIFAELCKKISDCADAISIAAHSISSIDVFSSFAELAVEQRYVRPEIDESKVFIIDSGRHPVVEKVLKNKFVANAAELEEASSFWLLTGPNMAGKSTFLRQNALIAIMAQIGCYVPATYARIGVVDKIFSRIGASDDISKGQSTFMVEMSETAAIINNATSKSLVILDEIGRGTATYDGLSIAWAVIEELHNNIKCRTFFATHYHELTDLEGKLQNLKCYTMNVKEWEDKLVFLHEVIPGKADRSYGIHVAELSGIPQRVTKRATEILEKIQSEKGKITIDFNNAATNDNEIANKLNSIDINILTPKDAFDLIYSLKKLV